MWKTLHRLDNDGLFGGKLIHPRHAHQPRHSVNFRRTGTALSGFAVPADSKIIGLLGLDLVNRIEHHHALGNLSGVFLKLALAAIAAPDLESDCCHFCSSITCFNSAGMSGIFSRSTCISPSLPRHTTMFISPKVLTFSE